jgi:predicted nucleotidyltransferase
MQTKGESLWPIRIWRLSGYCLYLSMKIEEPKIKIIKELCEENKVKTLYAFGSVTREDFSELSDIDLIVDFEEKDPYTYTDLYFNLKYKLEDLLKRHVDLIEERAIKNPFFRQQLENTKVKIYGY